MNFLEFKNTFEPFGVFSKNQIYALYDDFDRRRLYEWQQKGYIYKIRNNWYCFKELINIPNYGLFVANQIYKPSYISLEYALSYYELIPESVFTYTSVSTKKRYDINSASGNFSYKKIKSSLYFAYTFISFEKWNIRIAVPEKAILDFFYLNHQYNTEKEIIDLRLEEIFIHQLDIKLLMLMLEKFNNKALEKRIKLMLKIFAL